MSESPGPYSGPHLVPIRSLNPIREPRLPNTLQKISEVENGIVFKDVERALKHTNKIPFDIDFFKNLDLGPIYSMRSEFTQYYFSQAYDIGEGRIAVTAYVRAGNGDTLPVTYYRSNSHGLWRHLPGYIADEEGHPKHFSKGVGEESINLPIEIQESLAAVASHGVKHLGAEQAMKAFVGTVPQNWSDSAYGEEVPTGVRLEGNFYFDPQGKIVLVAGQLARTMHTPPEAVTFSNPAQEPDFTHMIRTWELPSKGDKKVVAEVFPSQDGQLHYMFCRDDAGRSWIAMVDKQGPIGPTGLKRQYVDAGDLCTPVEEYGRQAGIYGVEPSSGSSETYRDMYPKYLSHIPIIQRYEASRGQK